MTNQQTAGALVTDAILSGLDDSAFAAMLAAWTWAPTLEDSALGVRIHTPTVKRLARAQWATRNDWARATDSDARSTKRLRIESEHPEEFAAARAKPNSNTRKAALRKLWARLDP